REIHRYLGAGVDRVILHDGSFPAHLLGRYAARQQHPVEADVDAVHRLAPAVIVDQLLAIHRDHYIRHDAGRLIRAIFSPSASEMAALSFALAAHSAGSEASG